MTLSGEDGSVVEVESLSTVTGSAVLKWLMKEVKGCAVAPLAQCYWNLHSLLLASCQHEDSSSSLQNPWGQEWDVTQHACHPRDGGAETGRSLWLVQPPGLIREFQTRDNPSHKQSNKTKVNVSWGIYPKLSSRRHMHICTSEEWTWRHIYI